jgi:hypothetical protein
LWRSFDLLGARPVGNEQPGLPVDDHGQVGAKSLTVLGNGHQESGRNVLTRLQVGRPEPEHLLHDEPEPGGVDGRIMAVLLLELGLPLGKRRPQQGSNVLLGLWCR